MTRGASPLRFLGLVLGGWICARIVFLAPDWLTEAAVAEPMSPPSRLAAVAGPIRSWPVRPTFAHQPSHLLPSRAPVAIRAASPEASLLGPARKLGASLTSADPSLQERSDQLSGDPSLPIHTLAGASPADQALPLPIGTSAPGIRRWSLSIWAFARRGSGRQLATAGVLGGSQVGARATYGLTDRLAISARLYSPIERTGGAEAALGIEVQPLRSVPIRLLAERRQSLGREGRSAFSLLAHGGVSEQPLLGPLRLDAYMQAGLVGLRSRDAFADGAVRIGVPVTDDIKLGVGAWGAAQPGASRVDFGPQASYRLPVLGGRARLSAEWRVRVAGDARPGSGPALTVSTDF